MAEIFITHKFLRISIGFDGRKEVYDHKKSQLV
jgi:sulfatase maturation enzyme AslB (radical SAM superfamily)